MALHIIGESGGDRSEPTYRPEIYERGRVECIADSVSAAQNIMFTLTKLTYCAIGEHEKSRPPEGNGFNIERRRLNFEILILVYVDTVKVSKGHFQTFNKRNLSGT